MEPELQATWKRARQEVIEMCRKALDKLGAENPMTLAECHQLIASGAIPEDDRVELIEGRLVLIESRTARRGLPTSLTRTDFWFDVPTWLTKSSLKNAIPAGWYVASGQPVTLGENSELEPGVVVVRGNTRDYHDRRPGAGDLALVVDVVEASEVIIEELR